MSSAVFVSRPVIPLSLIRYPGYGCTLMLSMSATAGSLIQRWLFPPEPSGSRSTVCDGTCGGCPPILCRPVPDLLISLLRPATPIPYPGELAIKRLNSSSSSRRLASARNSENRLARASISSWISLIRSYWVC